MLHNIFLVMIQMFSSTTQIDGSGVFLGGFCGDLSHPTIKPWNQTKKQYPPPQKYKKKQTQKKTMIGLLIGHIPYLFR